MNRNIFGDGFFASARSSLPCLLLLGEAHLKLFVFVPHWKVSPQTAKGRLQKNAEQYLTAHINWDMPNPRC